MRIGTGRMMRSWLLRGGRGEGRDRRRRRKRWMRRKVRCCFSTFFFSSPFSGLTSLYSFSALSSLFITSAEARKAEEAAELEAFREKQREKLLLDPSTAEEEEDDEDVDHSFAHLRTGGTKGKGVSRGGLAGHEKEDDEQVKERADEARRMQAVRGSFSFLPNPPYVHSPPLSSYRPQRPLLRRPTTPLSLLFLKFFPSTVRPPSKIRRSAS